MTVLKTSIYFFKSAIRERAFIFWFLAFPIILMVMLITIFSSMTRVERINFNIYLIKPESNEFSNMIEDVFTKLSEGKDKIFNLRLLKDISSREKLIDDLKRGKTNLILEIPEGFDAQVLSYITFKMLGMEGTSPAIKIYSLKYNTSSETASMIAKNVFNRMNLEFVKKIRNVKEYSVKTEILGSKEGFSYVDFIYPGIVIVSIFFAGLMGIGQELSWYKEGKILKRYQLTPFSSLQFFISYFLARFYFFVLQVLLVTFVGKVIYKSSVNPLSFYFIFYVILSMLVLSTLGFFVSSISKNTNMSAIIAQLIQFPLQFLGGIYFPVFHVPWIIRWIVVINPITYLACGIRDTLGIMPSPYPLYLTILVPLLYIVIFLFIALKRYVGESS
ncbi:MAG: ABC transporter permease [Dictyoglomus sp.]|nr:ABC transporter permease [Dictyoglomus sp.]MDW8189212.1 ABC transporter permease [Dictyoglomus sp.]